MDKDGGPAFPIPSFQRPDGDIEWPQEGMSLRDWFAGQALPEVIREANAPELSLTPIGKEETRSEWAARQAYLYADAMLAEREARR